MLGSREDTIREVYGCFNDSRLGDLSAWLSPTCVLIQDPTFPDSRIWYGPEGVEEWFSQISGQLGTVTIDLVSVTAGQESVLAIVEISARGRASGAPVGHRMAHLWTFRDDAVETCRFYLDVREAEATFGRGTGEKSGG